MSRALQQKLRILPKSNSRLLENDHLMNVNEQLMFFFLYFFCQLFKHQKADNKINICKISMNVLFKLYHIENSKTRRKTV